MLLNSKQLCILLSMALKFVENESYSISKT